MKNKARQYNAAKALAYVADSLAYTLPFIKPAKHKPGYRGFICTAYGNTIVSEKKPLPNDKCSCGSGKKYKNCCG